MATRKSIFEILEEKYDFNKEFKKISGLFHGNIMYNMGYGYSVEIAVNGIFHQWKGRGSCINCPDMRQELGIDTILKQNEISPDDIILCLEYYVNILNIFATKWLPLSSGYEVNNSLSLLQTNIDLLLEHMNFMKHNIEEEEKILLLPKDPAAISVAEIASKDIAFAILKYNHASLKGQLEEKRRLLQSIANEYEALLNNPPTGFGEYFKTVKGLLNNMNIRHNNKTGKNKNDLVTNISPKMLESNYDELYQMLLFCVLTKDNLDRKKSADKVLKQIKG